MVRPSLVGNLLVSAIATVTQSGGTAKVIALSYGERGESGELWKEAGQTEEKVKAIRRTEGEEAAILGASFEGMDLGDYPLELDRAAMERLTAAIREFAPTVILTHAKEDPFNPDHGVAYAATEKARQWPPAQGWPVPSKPFDPRAPFV
jgi:4-oxalomesaconate hydratase